MRTMKATTQLCPIVLLICAARIVCTAQQRYKTNYAIGYPLGYADTKLIQDEYIAEKRNKPSLSIVNPLDVLRQRLLLEIARRQMKENTRQVELNRAIMKNVGKRNNDGHYNYKFPAQAHMPYRQQTYSFSTPHHQQQQKLQLQLQQQLLQQHYANHLEYAPDTTDYDYLQQPLYIYDSVFAGAATDGSESEREAGRHTSSYINALDSDAEDVDLNSYKKANENEMTNETTNENKNSNSVTERRNHGNGGDSTSKENAIGSNVVLAKNLPSNERLGLVQELEGNNGNADSQLRYLYGLRNKHRNMRK